VDVGSIYALNLMVLGGLFCANPRQNEWNCMESKGNSDLKGKSSWMKNRSPLWNNYWLLDERYPKAPFVGYATIAKGERVTVPITEHRLVIDHGKRSG